MKTTKLFALAGIMTAMLTSCGGGNSTPSKGESTEPWMGESTSSQHVHSYNDIGECECGDKASSYLNEAQRNGEEYTTLRVFEGKAVFEFTTCCRSNLRIHDLTKVYSSDTEESEILSSIRSISVYKRGYMNDELSTSLGLTSSITEGDEQRCWYYATENTLGAKSNYVVICEVAGNIANLVLNIDVYEPHQSPSTTVWIDTEDGNKRTTSYYCSGCSSNIKETQTYIKLVELPELVIEGGKTLLENLTVMKGIKLCDDLVVLNPDSVVDHEKTDIAEAGTTYSVILLVEIAKKGYCFGQLCTVIKDSEGNDLEPTKRLSYKWTVSLDIVAK